MKTAFLELRPGLRQRSDCSYWDYFVDGKRLADMLSIGDLIPPLGWLAPEIENHFVQMLLRKAVGDLPNNRVPLFICPECADYGCGTFSCVIQRTDAGIEWREFTMQNDYEEMISDESLAKMTLSFDPSQYFHTFHSRFQSANS